MTRILMLVMLVGCGGKEKKEPAIDYAPVRFIAIGDAGAGNVAQAEVAKVIAKVCADQGCDFGLMLGDNIYDYGVTSVDDPQWQEKFEQPYADLDFTFYAALGNHDYGGFSNLSNAEAQIAYSEVSDKWSMPAHSYVKTVENVDLIGLDTQVLLVGETVLPAVHAAQESWADGVFGKGGSDWRIAFGHHPYLSNGEHGNAGAYDGFTSDTATASGALVRDFVEQRLCGNVDLYLSGHDHDLELLQYTCDDTHFLVSGAASRLRTLPGSEPTLYSDASTEGFVWIEIDGPRLSLQFWDRDGDLNYEGGWDKR